MPHTPAARRFCASKAPGLLKQREGFGESSVAVRAAREKESRDGTALADQAMRQLGRSSRSGPRELNVFFDAARREKVAALSNFTASDTIGFTTLKWQ